MGPQNKTKIVSSIKCDRICEKGSSAHIQFLTFNDL